jgi:hypothetical protein
MRIQLKKTFSSLVVLVMIFAFICPLHFGLGADTASTEIVLTFLKDVAKLDMTKYNATLSGPYTDRPDDLGGLVEVYGQYNLKSDAGKITVLFSIINGTLCWCLLRFTGGTPQYAQSPPSNVVDAAKAFLQRYQAFSGDSSLNSMGQMLDAVDASKNSTKETGNVTLGVSVIDSTTTLTWSNTFNGATFSSLAVGFRDSSFYVFRDDRSYFRIGSTEVSLSKDQAISMALEKSSDFWYNYGGQRYSNFTIRKQFVSAALYTKARSEPLVMYPYWSVTLPLDHMYPGHVTMIMVEIWADTSEVIRMYELGTGGGDISPTSSPTPTASPPPHHLLPRSLHKRPLQTLRLHHQYPPRLTFLQTPHFLLLSRSSPVLRLHPQPSQLNLLLQQVSLQLRRSQQATLSKPQVSPFRR